MLILLSIARLIDAVNLFVGRWISWVVLVVVLVSTCNALARKFLHIGSNAWLEVQWYLFGALFLLASGYTLLKNGHVRVDVLSSKLSKRKQIVIEIVGTLLFLMPAAVLIMVLAWPMFWESWVTQEASPNAGGLIRWPAKLLVPIGFLLLIAAGVSHLIKCAAFLMGSGPDPTARDSATTQDEQLIEALHAQQAAGMVAARPGKDH